ncbi:MAG: hypothetical protein J6B87_04805 [Clostridia bacterium]|nr:hypothetical protein [Clostridia bacterium]
MQIFMRILKELGIALLFLLLILGILAFAFYDKVPYGTKVPDPIDYASINKDEYNIRGDLEDQANATQTYETSTSQLEEYLTEKIVSPGRFDPFNPINSVSDVPSEKVSGTQSGEFVEPTIEGESANDKTSADESSTSESALE